MKTILKLIYHHVKVIGNTLSPLLPMLETQMTNQMATWFDFCVFVIFSANLAKLKRGTHLNINFILLLCHLNMLFSCFHQKRMKIRIGITAIRKQITKESKMLIINSKSNFNNIQGGTSKLGQTLMSNKLNTNIY